MRGLFDESAVGLELTRAVTNLRFLLILNWRCFLFELHSRMLCAQWTCHVTPARLLICFLLRIMCYQLRYLCFPSPFPYGSYLPFWSYDMSVASSLFPLVSCRLVWRLVIPGLLTSCDLFVHLRLVCMFVLVSRKLLYIRVEDGTAPHLQSTLQPP